MFPKGLEPTNKEIVLLHHKDDIIKYAIDYFFSRDNTLYYPSKSYSVAYIYSVMLVRNFGGELKEYLNDESLLYYNDDYFKTYDSSPEIYDILISEIGNDLEQYHQGWVDETIKYFNQECLGEYDVVKLLNIIPNTN